SPGPGCLPRPAPPARVLPAGKPAVSIEPPCSKANCGCRNTQSSTPSGTLSTAGRLYNVRAMSVLTVSGLSKTYASGFNALKNVSLEIRRGEIFALLGPNGAGKTTLINIICGIVTPSSGQITADGFDIARDFRQARTRIG